MTREKKIIRLYNKYLDMYSKENEKLRQYIKRLEKIIDSLLSLLPGEEKGGE